MGKPYQHTKMKGFFPIYTPWKVSIVLFLLGLICVILSIFILKTTENECIIPYGKPYTANSLIELNLSLCQKREFKAPVEVFYEVKNFYQNERIYSQSLPILKKEYGENSFVGEQCSARNYGDDGRILFPCGLVAGSVFNDTFTFQYKTQPVQLDLSQVAWEEDVKAIAEPTNIPSNVDYWLDQSIFPGGVTNVHFLSWLRLSPFPQFRKLYGKIHSDDSYIKLDNMKAFVHYRWDLSAARVTQALVFSESGGSIGGNHILGNMLLIGGLVEVAIAIFIFIAGLIHHKRNQRNVERVSALFKRYGVGGALDTNPGNLNDLPAVTDTAPPPEKTKPE